MCIRLRGEEWEGVRRNASVARIVARTDLNLSVQCCLVTVRFFYRRSSSMQQPDLHADRYIAIPWYMLRRPHTGYLPRRHFECKSRSGEGIVDVGIILTASSGERTVIGPALRGGKMFS